MLIVRFVGFGLVVERFCPRQRPVDVSHVPTTLSVTVVPYLGLQKSQKIIKLVSSSFFLYELTPEFFLAFLSGVRLSNFCFISNLGKIFK